MALLGQLTVGILGDTRGFSDGLTQAQKDTVKFTKNIERMGRDISTIGYGFQDLGSKLTKSITVPILGTVTAVGGLTAALGWKRLVGLDSAKAQLKGLGYEAKDVERITGQVTTAIDGGMTTMAEGTAVAAGALAAGVEEGKELERYIKLVGDAAVGANRPVDEMAQIFNRVQGQGKLMTQELNMIEMGLPGFAQAMADNVADGSLESFREMVTAGEVGSKEFLDVMDEFAGGMASAYSESWAGMVKNTLAYIGIIGESLLEGVFQVSKEEIAGFIEVLKSDAVLDWAQRTGEAIHNAFDAVLDKVRAVKQWYDDLSPAMQDLTKKIALFGSIGAVAIGPFLLIIGKVIVGVGTLVTRIGAIAGAVTKLGGVFGILTGPIGITIGVITGLVAAGVLLYKNWDKVKAKAEAVFLIFEPLLNRVKESFQSLLDSTGPIMDNLSNLWQSLLPILEVVGVVVGAILVGAFGVLVSVLNGVIQAIAPLTNALINFVDFVVNMVNAVVALLTGDFAGAWQYLQDAGQSTIDFFVNMVNGILDLLVGFVDGVIDFFYGLYMTLVGNSIIPDMVEAIVEWFQNLFQWLFDIVEMIVDAVVDGFNFMREQIENIIELIVGIIEAGLIFMREIFSIYLDLLIALITGDFESMNEIIGRLTGVAKDLISNVWSSIDQFLSKTLGNMWTNVKDKFTEIKDSVQTRTGEAKDKLVENFNSMVSNTKEKASEIVSTVSTKFTDAKNKIMEPIESAKDKIKGYIDEIKGFFDNLKLKIPKPELPSLPTFSLKTSSKSVMGKSISYPSGFDVNWNALGGIFKNPTIFNTANAGLQGVGEAGAEAIIPLNAKVLGGIGEGIANTMTGNDGEMVQLLSEQVSDTKQVISLLSKILIGVSDNRIDRNRLARILEPEINKLQSRKIDNYEVYR